MFRRLVVPIDLAHREALTRVLAVAADLARHYAIPVTYVGVTAETPTPQAHSPGEFAAKMQAFAADEAARHGIEADGKGYASHDPAIELDTAILNALEEADADLVVMASHIPNLADHLWPSHGGHIAARAKASVLIVRPQGNEA